MHRNRRTVRLVSGSWPPEICGVGDFMANLADALEAKGVDVRRERLTRSSLGTALRVLASAHAQSQETIVVSYPTEGYGKSLLPFLLAFGPRERTVLHVHEYGSKNRYCRFLLRRFRRLRRIFFSNDGDYRRYLSDCGLEAGSARTRDWLVVPTPSNIPVTAQRQPRNGQRVRIIHFGQIRPLKGLERLAEAFAAFRSDDRIERVVVVGGVPAGYEAYAAEISAAFVRSGAHVRLGLSAAEISAELAQAQIGVFAFPDGADERRGSLVAAMAHGLLCVVPHSSRTPPAIRTATVGFETSGSPATDALCTAMRHAIDRLDDVESSACIGRALAVGRAASFTAIAERLVAA